MSLHSDTEFWFRPNQYLPIVWPDRGSNSRSTILNKSTLTIIPLKWSPFKQRILTRIYFMYHFNILRCLQKLTVPIAPKIKYLMMEITTFCTWKQAAKTWLLLRFYLVNSYHKAKIIISLWLLYMFFAISRRQWYIISHIICDSCIWLSTGCTIIIMI